MRSLLISLLLCVACQPRTETSEAPSDEAPSVSTRWVSAHGVENLSLLEATASVLAAPNASAVVTVPASARVMNVRVRAGEAVEAGQPLVDVLVPEVVHAAGALSSAQLRLEAAEARRTRLAPLVEQGLAKSSELAELSASIASTRAEAQTARATLRAAGISDQRATSLLESDGAIALRSPLTGMVTAVNTRPGEVRDPTSGPLVEVAGSSEVQIEARLMNSLPSHVSFEWTSPSGDLKLILTSESPRASSADGSRLAWFAIAPGQPSPTPGSVGRVRIAPQASWVVLPSRAVKTVDGKASVIVLRGERSAPQPVQLILQSGSEVVVSGIDKGTLVAADGELAGGSTP